MSAPTIVSYARVYAAHLGWSVFPLHPGRKEPIPLNGFYGATRDIDELASRWRIHPDANLGLRTGVASGVVAVDIDVKDGAQGEQSFAALERELGALPATLSQRTWSGGRQLLFRKPEAHLLGSPNGFRSGIDLRGDGGYIVIAPSVVKGQPYTWQSDPFAPLAELPESWVQAWTPTGVPKRRRFAPVPEYTGLVDSHDATKALRSLIATKVAKKNREEGARAELLRRVLDGEPLVNLDHPKGSDPVVNKTAFGAIYAVVGMMARKLPAGYPYEMAVEILRDSVTQIAVFPDEPGTLWLGVAGEKYLHAMQCRVDADAAFAEEEAERWRRMEHIAGIVAAPKSVR